MELKEYQKKTLEQVKHYLTSLAEFKSKNEKAIEVDTDLSINFPLKAWGKDCPAPSGQQIDWRKLNLEFTRKRIEFQVIFEDEWQTRINKIFGGTYV